MESTFTSIDSANPLEVTDSSIARASISWAAVFSGAAIAIAVQIGLTQLCVSCGLALFEPATPGSSIAAIASNGAVALLITTLFSLFFGGWVAGRVARHSSPGDAAIHGSLVWAVCGLAGLVLMAGAAGVLAGGTAYLGGQSLNALATTVSTIAPAAAEVIAPSWAAVKEQVENELAVANSATSADSRLADRSRLMELLASSFTADRTADRIQKEKSELITLLAAQTGVTPAAATRAVDQWQRQWADLTQAYEAKKAAAEARAKELSGQLAERTSRGALYAFLATIIGLVTAYFGALLGFSCVCRVDEIELVPQSSRVSTRIVPV